MSVSRMALAVAAFALAALPCAGDTYDRALRLETADGVIVHGVVLVPDAVVDSGSPAPAVILLHGYGRDSDSLRPLADMLAGEGLVVALPDLRGHGRSRRRTDRTLYVFPVVPAEEFSLAERDTRQLLDELLRDADVDGTRIGVVGVGEGALVAAAAAARRPELRSVVLVDASEENALLRPRRALGIVGRRPVLLVCSAAPASRARAEALAQYGLGEREVACADSFEPRDRLVQPGEPAAERVTRWLVETLSPAVR